MVIVADVDQRNLHWQTLATNRAAIVIIDNADTKQIAKKLSKHTANSGKHGRFSVSKGCLMGKS